MRNQFTVVSKVYKNLIKALQMHNSASRLIIIYVTCTCMLQIGSKQCFNLSICGTYPQLGRAITNDRQYITKEEYIDIVRHAESLGITVCCYLKTRVLLVQKLRLLFFGVVASCCLYHNKVPQLHTTKSELLDQCIASQFSL